MNRWGCLLFILACLSQIGCTALLTEQEYVLIDRLVLGKVTRHGEIFWLPERADIRKIVILGSGQMQNIEIYVRDERDQWKLLKIVPNSIQFPLETPLIAETDAVKIIKLSTRGGGRIDTIQFYTVAEKSDAKL